MAEELPQPSEVRRLQLAYLNVFGPLEKRSADQRLVWQDLESFCYAHRLVTEKADDHSIDVNSTLFNDGRRSVWLRARGQIIRAQMNPKPVKISRKPKTQIQHGQSQSDS